MNSLKPTFSDDTKWSRKHVEIKFFQIVLCWKCNLGFVKILLAQFRLVWLRTISAWYYCILVNALRSYTFIRLCWNGYKNIIKFSDLHFGKQHKVFIRKMGLFRSRGTHLRLSYTQMITNTQEKKVTHNVYSQIEFLLRKLWTGIK